MVNANWLLVFWGFFTTVVVVFVVFGGQEAEAINEITIDGIIEVNSW